MNFLKAFIFPSKMRRFRTMSGFIAILIFLVLMYLAIVPVRVKYSKADYVISQNGYDSKIIYEAVSDYDYSQIKSKNYIIDLTKLELTAGVRTTTVYKIDANYENKNVVFNVVFDLEKDKYDQNEDLFETYAVEKNDDNYLLLFSLNFYEFQRVASQTVDGVTSKIFQIVTAATYNRCPIDFNSYGNVDEFLDGIANAFAILYGEVYTSSFSFTSALMLFFLPLLLIIVMWLILRKNGSLKKFKEYYNIAAIASIIPSLIAFAVAWFWPQVINFYTTIFVVYYLFVIYRINAMPLEDEVIAPVKKPAPKQVVVEASEVSVKEEHQENNNNSLDEEEPKEVITEEKPEEDK